MAAIPKSNVVVIDDGTREYVIKNQFGKEICKIHFRPADFSIIDRYNALMADFAKIIDPLKDLSIRNDGTADFEEDWKVLKTVEADLKAKINALLDTDDADAIFSARNPFSSIGGQFFCFRVLTALEDLITGAIQEEAEASKSRMAKYLEDIETPKKVSGDAGATPEGA